MNGHSRYYAWLFALGAPSLGLVLGIWIAASTWERVKTTPAKRTIQVTGSATKRIVSDLIEWRANIVTKAADRVTAYRDLHKHVALATDYLKKQGIAPEDLRVSSVTSEELFRTEYEEGKFQKIEKRVADGWSTTQSIFVRSKDIARVEQVSREITQLIESGVSVESVAPTYHFTKLDQLKIEMLALAAGNARERAEKIIKSSGGEGIGGLWDADMGVINVNPANSNATTWEGNNDKTSLEKDIITIVHLTYQLP